MVARPRCRKGLMWDWTNPGGAGLTPGRTVARSGDQRAIRRSAIWTAFSAAPLQRLSPQAKSSSSSSWPSGWRILPTSASSIPAASRGSDRRRWPGRRGAARPRRPRWPRAPRPPRSAVRTSRAGSSCGPPAPGPGRTWPRCRARAATGSTREGFPGRKAEDLEEPGGLPDRAVDLGSSRCHRPAEVEGSDQELGHHLGCGL